MSKKKLKHVIKRLEKRLEYETEMCNTLKNDSTFLGYSCEKLNRSNRQLKKDINFIKGLKNEF